MTAELQIPIPETVKSLITQSNELAKTPVSILSADDYEQAGNERDLLKRREKELVERRLSITRPMDEAKKRVMELFAVPLNNLATAIQVRDDVRLLWKRKQEALRLEEENRRKAILAEEERKLKEAAAKIEAEAKAKEEKLRLEAEEAAQAGNVGKAAKLQERAEAMIEKAETQIKIKQQQAASLPPATVATTVPEGGYRKTYKPVLREGIIASSGDRALTGFELFICSVADGIRSGAGFPPASYLEPNWTAIRQYCNSTKQAFRLPGWELAKDEVPVSKRGSR